MKEGKIVTAMEHVPEYLRVSQAERERARSCRKRKLLKKTAEKKRRSQSMILREMLVDDLDQVMKIENELFSPTMVRKRDFLTLSDPQGCHVPCSGEKGEILAYCG